MLIEETDEFFKRIQNETREKILNFSEPINLKSLSDSMKIDEPDYLGCVEPIKKEV